MYKYIENAIENYNENSSHGLLLKHIPKNSRVLEFGCGKGVFASYITETLGCTVTGVDISEEAIEFAEAHIDTAIVADLESKGWQKLIPQKDYDVILCADLLEHLSSPERFLVQAGKLLAEDGKILFSVPNLAHADVLVNLFSGRFNYTDIGLLDTTHIHFFAKDNILQMFSNAGLELYDLTGTTAPMGGTEQAFPEAAESTKRAVLCADYNNVYQFVGAAYKKDYAKKNGITFNDTLPKNIISTAKVYFDRGNGLSETDTAVFPIQGGITKLEIEIPKGTKQIRFDPTDSGTFIATDISFKAGKKELVPHATACIEQFGNCIIYTDDPQYYITLEDTVKTVTVEFTVLSLLITDSQLTLIRDAASAHSRSTIDRLQGELSAKETSIGLLQGSIGQLQGEIGLKNRSIQELTQQSELLAKDTERLNQQISSLSQQLSELNASYAKSCEELTEMVAKNIDLVNSVTSYQQTTEKNQKQIRELNTEKDKLTQTLEAQKKSIRQLEEDLKKAIQTYNEAHHKNQMCMEQIADLTDDRDRHAQALAEERANAARLQVVIETYQLHYNAAIEQRDALQAHARNLEEMYQNISTSASWKITKPVRATLDLIKKILKKILPVSLIKRGFRCYRENGLRYTLRRIKEKRKARKAAKRTVYGPEELEMQRKTVFPKKIKFSILVPLYNTPLQFLEEMIDSVKNQTYANWELCLADGSDKDLNLAKEVKRIAKGDSRIRYKKLAKNFGISENTNACIKMATGDYIALFDHDDLLHPAALYEVMRAICEKDADFIYTDENTFSQTPADAYCPHHKPDFAPDLLRSYNYICHFTVFSKTLLKKIGGGFRKEFDGSQDYDIILRLTEQAQNIVHIPQILYYWRAHRNSVASDISAKPYTLDAARRALAEHLERVGLKGTVTDSRIPSTYRIQYELTEEPLVSLIIPNMDHIDVLDQCIQSVEKRSTYRNFEILIVENNSRKDETFAYYDKITKEYDNIRVVRWAYEFNYSKINNFALKSAKGKYVVLLNNDIEILTPSWIEEMLMFVQRDDVGAAGIMLYYPDDTVQHAGVILGIGGVAGHSHKYFPRGDYGYMSRMTLAQNLSAVTAACMMIKTSVLEEVGGLDETLAVAFNDVDLCMKIREAGHLIVWTPYAEAYHYESKSRGLEDTPEKQKRFQKEVYTFMDKWGDVLAKGDPYYNPNLTLEHENFSLK